jgi:hypothetical protein
MLYYREKIVKPQTKNRTNRHFPFILQLTDMVTKPSIVLVQTFPCKSWTPLIHLHDTRGGR